MKSHQKIIRENNLQEDLKAVNLSLEDSLKLRCSDFTFSELTSKEERREAKEFIEKHEWLGNLSQYTTQWYGAKCYGVLAGVILFNMPNAFSKLMGERTPELERLISRGACISWSPKNLASNFLTWCISDAVQKTQYRLFTCYSDPEAAELGTIYQACNFYYLGQNAGTNKRYISPFTGKEVSDRAFRQKTYYKRFAGQLGITWEKDWQSNTGMIWANVPDEVEARLRQASKDAQSNAVLIPKPSKHKYAFLLGRDKRETRSLRKEFLTRNKVYDYPKNRGLDKA